MKKLLNKAETNYKEDKDDTDSWCCICNDDGNFKCIDCDDDVYCKRCFKYVLRFNFSSQEILNYKIYFRECHDKYEYKTHRKKNF